MSQIEAILHALHGCDRDTMPPGVTNLANHLNSLNVEPTDNMPICLFTVDTDQQVFMSGYGLIEPHPEGSDRGGHVITWNIQDNKATYNFENGEWR